MNVLIQKISRFTGRMLVAFALVSVAALAAVALFGEKALKDEVERRLAGALNRRVTVSGLTVNLAARRVELRDVVIPGLPGSPRPSFASPRVRLALSFRSLFTRRILLRGLELERPRISVQVFPDGSTDVPQVSSSSDSPSTQVSIEALVVKSGDLFLNDQKIPLELAWPNVEASLSTDARRIVKGQLRAGPGPMGFFGLPPLDAALEAKIRFTDSMLYLDSGSFVAAETKLSLTGQLDLHKESKGEIRFSGPLDLDRVDRSILDTGLDLEGIAETKAVLSVDGEKRSLTATLAGRNGSFDSIPLDVFSTRLSWDGSDLRLKELQFDALGGHAEFEVEAPQKAAVKVAGTLAGMRLEPLLHWLFAFETAGLGSRVSGPIDIAFPRGATNLLSGTGDLQLVGDPAQGDPLFGRFPFRAEKGVVTTTGARLEALRTSVTIDGSVHPDRRMGLDVKLVSADLAATDNLGVRLRRALGAPSPEPLLATGRGSFAGHVSGTTSEPVFTGRFLGTAISYLNVLWSDVDWTGSVSAMDLKSERLVATRGASRVELSGSQRLGATGIDDALDLNIATRDWPANELLRVVGSALEVDTAVSGTMRIMGLRSRPLGRASLTSPAGRASGVPFSKAELTLEFQGEALRIESLKAVMGGGDFLVKGILTKSGASSVFDGEAEFREIELSDLGLQSEAPMIGGHVTGRARFSGPIETPRVVAHFESKRLFYGEEGIGALAVEIEGEGDGSLNVSGRMESARLQAEVSGAIQAKAPYASQLDLKVTNARVDPVLRALGSRFENAVVITASAHARVEGPLSNWRSISARVREGRLRVAVPEYAVEAAPGFVIDVEDGKVRIAGLTLVGEGTSVAVSGNLALNPGDVNDLAVTGRADLRVFSGFLREWRLRGSATLRSQISGSAKAIRILGGLDVEDGALRLRTFPQGLEGLNGRVVFNETQARVAGLEGRFGGSRVSVSGQAGFGGAAPSTFDFSLKGDSVGLRYPEGLRSTFGAELRLQGTTDSYWLTGELLVAKALWSRNYAITSELFNSAGDAASFSTALGLKPSPMRLDIAIKAPGTLRLENNLASLVARADLSLTGSPTEPQLLGRVEVERGKVFFGGNTYEVRKGVAHFSNPRDINPVFDIEADTRLRSYRLTLQANGTLDRVSTRITSDPPLTSPQIASLLTGGDENEIANLSNSRNDLKTIGAGSVNSLASAWLGDNVTGRVARGFGLSRLSIDPGLLNRTGSRLTVGTRVTSDLEVVYTQNIFGGAENRLVTAEYSLSNRFSLVLGWAEPGGPAVDVRTRITLGR